MSVDKKKRNRFAGKSTGTSKSAKYFRDNPKARKKKREAQKKYNATDAAKKRRAELNKKNRENHRAGKSKVGDKLDVSHTKKKTTVLEKQSSNRARQGKGGKSRLK